MPPQGENEKTPRYLRLTKDLRIAATALLEEYRALCKAIVDSSSSWAYVGLRAVDEDEARDLWMRTRAFAEHRLKLRLFLNVREYLRTGSFVEQIESGEIRPKIEILSAERITQKGRTIQIATEHLVPAELLEVGDEISRAFHPTFSIGDCFETFTAFSDSYNASGIVSMYDLREDERIGDLVYRTHMALRSFVKLAILETSSVRPCIIVLFPELGSIRARIDGRDVDLSPKAMRTLLVLSQLGYERWFSTDTFCERVYGTSETAADDFQRAMKIVQKAAPSLTWNTDPYQNRRLLNVVVECECAEDEVNRFLEATKPPKKQRLTNSGR